MPNIGPVEIILLLAIWVLPIVLCYRLGSRHGVSAVISLLLGVLLGWLGLLIVWLIARERPLVSGA